MVRTLVLALMLVAAAAGPAHAGNRGHGSRGGHHSRGHHGHGFHTFVGVGIFAPYPFYDPYYDPYYYPYYVYPPPAVVVVQPPPVIELAPIQREVIYPTGRYVLHGDGVTYPYQW